jgi:hypothetical protein
MAKFVTLGHVGPHQEGEVVDFPSDMDTQRLLDLGVVRKATAKDGDAVTYGNSPTPGLKAIPPAEETTGSIDTDDLARAAADQVAK